jgi:hypothetical protein
MYGIVRMLGRVAHSLFVMTEFDSRHTVNFRDDLGDSRCRCRATGDNVRDPDSLQKFPPVGLSWPV